MPSDTQHNKKTKSARASLWRFLVPYRAHISISVLGAVASSCLWLSLGQGLQSLVDDGFLPRSTDALRTGILLLLGLVLAYSLISFLQYWLIVWVGERVTADIRKAVFDHVIGLHPGFFEENSPGEIESRITYDAGTVQYALSERVSDGFIDVFLVFGAGVLLFMLDLKLASMTLVIVPLISWPAMYLGRQIKQAATETQDHIALMNDYVGESLTNVRMVQAYNRKAWHQRILSGHVENVVKAEMAYTRRYGALYAVVYSAISCVIGLMLWIGGQDVLAGRLSGGELAAFIFYAYVASSSIDDLTYLYGDIQSARGSTKRLMELLVAENLIQRPARPLPAPQPCVGQLVLDRVGYRYPSRPDRAALDDVSLTIQPRETVAFVGPSGAGKSTLFALLLRFCDPTSGKVFLDGVNIREMDPDELRSYCAIVPQDLTLFSATVIDNIRYGREEADTEQIVAAAKAAHIHEFITAELPDGYNTHLGTAGVRLSGGQRQRIAIARAVLKDPRILLFDEATSALDAENEALVKQALSTVMQGRTTLIIAHRLGTVMSADRIVVMDQGRVVEEGTHETLMKSCPLYRVPAEHHYGLIES